MLLLSQLQDKLLRYDPFGEHRTNGLKAVFVLELMFLFNLIYGIPNAYFYYFYIPLTAFAAEIAGNTLAEKFYFYCYTVIGSIIAVFCFGVFSSYKVFFIFFVFFFSFLIYFMALRKIKSLLVPAPLILSLAAYSMTYGNSNSNFYVALNHALQTTVAMLIVVGGLILFPRRYYLAIWRRAFCNVVLNLENLTAKICRGEIEQMPIINGLIVMDRYSKMLSRRMPYYSILKITLLTAELVMAMSYLLAFHKQLRQQYIVVLQAYYARLAQAARKGQSLPISVAEQRLFAETHELRTLYQLIISWNYLCQGN